MIQRLHSGTLPADGTIHQGLADFFTQYLDQAVSLGWHAVDSKLRGYLAANVQRFSGFRTYAVQQAIREKLTDDEGNIRPFADFRTDALAINQRYNVDYLRTEYETAIASAQMASKWSEFPTDALLRYDTAGDDHVRHEHAVYDGITRPKNDPFWDSHFPPCDWSCRCVATEVDGDTPITPDSHLHGLPPVPEEFRQNAGKTGEIFGPDHPYFDVPQSIARKINGQLPVLQSKGPLLPEDLVPFVPGGGRRSAAQQKGEETAQQVLRELLPGLPHSPHLDAADLAFGKLAARGELYYDNPPSIQMVINNQLKRAGSNAMTILHESGHWMDLAHLDTPLEVAGNFRGRDLGPIFEAIRKTERWQGYEQLMADFKAGDERISQSEYDYVADYLRTPYETWARAFAQYAATKSGSKLLLDEVYLYAKGEDAEQWQAHDFRGVTAAIDELFTRKRWLRKP